ncbi:MAG: DUF72 domain-containing protein [Bacteroidia bacterium]
MGDGLLKNLYIGTSGWSYSNWKPTFYPENLKSADFLSFYARHFPTTEINSSFYHFTMKKTIEKWLEATPENFRFSAKFHRSITHYQKLKDIEAPLIKYAEIFTSLKPKLGPILIQLPPSLNFQENIVKPFYITLRNIMPDFTFALEARHTSWFTDESFELMAEFDIANVWADAGRRFPSSDAVTNNEAYIRLHGREKLYASDYEDDVLEYFAERIVLYLEEGLRVWVYFNNTMYGHALQNAQTLESMIKKRINT